MVCSKRLVKHPSPHLQPHLYSPICPHMPRFNVTAICTLYTDMQDSTHAKLHIHTYTACFDLTCIIYVQKHNVNVCSTHCTAPYWPVLMWQAYGPKADSHTLRCRVTICFSRYFKTIYDDEDIEFFLQEYFKKKIARIFQNNIRS